MDNIKGFVLFSLLKIILAQENCHVINYVDPGVEEKVPCIFPFTYKGVEYSHCTSQDHPERQEWCSTKTDDQGVHVSGSGHWGVCSTECPHDPVCPQGWSRLKTGCYKVLEESMNKFDSLKECQKQGGYLAEIGSKEEVDVLNYWYKSKMQVQCLYDADILWIGVHNDTERDEWVSDRSGEAVQFTYWLDTEPTHHNDNEKCIAIFANNHFSNDFQLKEFGWFDENCNTTKMDFYKNWRLNARGLCERDTLDDFDESTNTKLEKLKVAGSCYEGWTEIDDKCYLFETHPSTYREAKIFCELRGAHLVNIESEKEYEAVKKVWKMVENNRTLCGDQIRSWWIGITDGEEEGKWISDQTGLPVTFTKWNPGEPNNYGGGVPGEDCAIAHLWEEEDQMKWYDVTCTSRGFSWGEETTVSFNPLCEMEKFSSDDKIMEHTITEDEVPQDIEGMNQDWIKVGGGLYKFVRTAFGVTQKEAKQICQGNGGYLAVVDSEDKRVALQEYYLGNIATSPNKGSVVGFLDYFQRITGLTEKDMKHAWWVGATDEENESHWVWEQTKRNVTDSPWFFFGRGIPGAERFNQFGDDDCAFLFDKQEILSDGDWGENEKYRSRVENEEDSFKMMMGSCYTRVFIPDWFDFVMHPLCESDE